MDRPIPNKLKQRRWLRRVAVAAGITVVVLVATILLRDRLRPSVKRGEVRIASTERGSVAETVSASGVVVPEYEHVISSPIDTRVTQIFMTPGEQLVPGSAILLLDVSGARLALDKLEDQLALKANERERAVQDLANQKVKLLGNEEIKALDLTAANHDAEQAKNCFDIGMYSMDEVRKAQLKAEKTSIELRQIRESIANADRMLSKQLEGLDLELSILTKDRDEAARQLELAAATSDRPGVLTWVLASEGQAVKRGDEIARVADLSSFLIEATVSDVQGPRIHAGQPVTVQAGDERLPGKVSRVRPTVENGTITLEVELDEKRHESLRHNMRVEVYIATAIAGDAIRIPRGQILTIDGQPMLFVIDGERAVRRPVTLGLRSFEYQQVVDGLAVGDEIILSDMRDFQHVTEVRLR